MKRTLINVYMLLTISGVTRLRLYSMSEKIDV